MTTAAVDTEQPKKLSKLGMWRRDPNRKPFMDMSDWTEAEKKWFMRLVLK